MNDPFDLFGLEPSYDLSPSELSRRHRELGKALHPDRFAGAPAGERRQALSRAIDVNDAYRNLRHPVKRAEALLLRLGAGSEESSEPMDPEFLMDVMEQREALSAAGRAGDHEALERLVKAASASKATLDQALSEKFRSALKTGNGASPELKDGVGRLRYLQRFLEEANALLDEID